MANDKKTITGVLLDVENQKVEKVTFEPTLEKYYSMLHCDTIDITHRSVNGRRVSIVCDDEGMFKQEPLPSAFDSKGQPMLVGSLLFIGEADGDGEDTSLPEDLCQHVLDNVATLLMTKVDGSMRKLKAVINCEYC